MLKLLYNISIYAYGVLILMACPFNEKARRFRKGRLGWKKTLQNGVPNSHHVTWFHVASLGEFEQGRPVLEAIRERYKTFILLTFFSPSGYEVQKAYETADLVSYLPLDTPTNAATFTSLVKPDIAILVKYDFWLNHLESVLDSGTKGVVVSARFRKGQFYFAHFGGLFRNIFRGMSHFFVQEHVSCQLIRDIGANATVAGDTRMDRVVTIARQGALVPEIEAFREGKKLFICGSIWPSDMDLLMPLITKWCQEIKFLLVPHEFHESWFRKLERRLPGALRFSSVKDIGQSQHSRVMILDEMGLLSRAYASATYAYVGGARAHGLHNTLEAVVHRIPVFFAKHKSNAKFAEVSGLREYGAAIEVDNAKMFANEVETLEKDHDAYTAMSAAAQRFVEAHTGATDKIMQYLDGLYKP